MTSSDCPAISSSLHPLITQNLVDTAKYYCPFQDRGFCRDKTKCNFSHERNNSIKVPLDYCHFYLANRCLYGVECKFQHIEPLEPLTSITATGSSAAASSSLGYNSLNESNTSDYTNQSSSCNQPSTSSTSRELNVAFQISRGNNNYKKISRDQTVANPPTNRAYHQNNDNLAVDGLSSQQQRLIQPSQFAHHSQYWYHTTIPSSSTNPCPFLGGLEKSSPNYHNRIPNHYSSNEQPENLEPVDHRYMQVQEDIYHQHQNIYNSYNDFVPQRLSSSLPSLTSTTNSNNQYLEYQNHDVDTTNELINVYEMRQLSSQLDTGFHPCRQLIDTTRELHEMGVHNEVQDSNEAWAPVATFCRRHSIGHIDMISDEHLLLSCDLCGRRCLQPADQEQQRLHRDECLRELEQEMELSFAIQRSKDKVCGICMDIVVEKKPVTSSRFGILEKCNHIFCLDCIRKWRGTKQFENRTIRACPECRTCSDFVVPSKYWVEDKDDKEKLIHDYKENLKSKACKYFDEGRGECPFAGACFYKHAYPDGRIAKFNKPKPSRRYHSRNFSLAAARLIVWNIIRRPNRRDDEEDEDDDDDDDDEFDLDGDDIINIITDEDVNDTDVDEVPLGEDANEIERIISVNEVIENNVDDEDDEEEDQDEDEDVNDDDDEFDLDGDDHLDLDEFEIPTFEDYDTEDFDYAPVRFQYRLP